MDEKKRPGEGGADEGADSPRAPGSGFIGDKLKRLEKKRRPAYQRPGPRNGAVPDVRQRDGEAEPGPPLDADHPADYANHTAPFPTETGSLGKPRAVIGRDIPLSRDDQDFLQEHSLGPICGLYMVNGVLWPFLLPLALGLMPLAQLGLPIWAAGVAALTCLFCPAALAVVFFHVGFLVLNRPWDLAVPFPASGNEPSVVAGYIYIGTGWLVLAYILALGRWSRRMRWRGLGWHGFEAFRRTEGLWCTLGGFLAVPAAAALFGVLFLKGLDRFAEWLQEFYYIYF